MCGVSYVKVQPSIQEWESFRYQNGLITCVQLETHALFRRQTELLPKGF